MLSLKNTIVTDCFANIGFKRSKGYIKGNFYKHYCFN